MRMKAVVAVVLLLMGIAAIVLGLYMIHPGLALVAAGVLALRHALTLDNDSE